MGKKIIISRKKVVTFIGILVVVLALAAIIVQVTLNVNDSKIIRVACMGDSITDERYSEYTSDLQNMLGENYTAKSFGIMGATVLFDTYHPYWEEDDFSEAQEFLPDIVVIMLGTNDARPDNFGSIDNFVGDYIKIIKQIQLLGTKPKVFIVKPPPIFENVVELVPENFSEEIIPRIEEVANTLNLEIIDVYSVMQNHPEYLIDGVHPNAEGSTVIATQVYNAIIGSG